MTRAIRLAALLLLLLTVGVTDLPVLHEHGGSRPGLFNEECPSARLATGIARGVPVASPEPLGLAPTADAAPALVVSAPRPSPVRPAGARAPPAAC
jgi:hypothetical protein